MDSLYLAGDTQVTELNDGNFAIGFCGMGLDVDVTDATSENYGVYYMVIDADGETVIAPRALEGFTGCDNDQEWTEHTQLSRSPMVMS